MQAQIHNLKKFIKEALNLPDNAGIMDFSIQTKDKSIIVMASIQTEISMEALTSLGLKDQSSNGRLKSGPKPKVTRSKKNLNYSYNRDFTTSEEDFTVLRVILRDWRKRNMLTEAEVQTMANFGGKFYKSMSETEKQAMLDFFNSIRHAVIAGLRSKKREQTATMG